MEAVGNSSFDVKWGLQLIEVIPPSNVHEEISLIVFLTGIIHLELCSLNLH